MIRELILLRHAHAEHGDASSVDAERPLSPNGAREADSAGTWLKEQGASPDRVLCSPAVRARQTCERALAKLEIAQEILIDPRIYDATPASLLALLDEQSESECVLLVGHNPGLEDLAALLGHGASDSGRGMPPATVAWLALDDGTLEPGSAEVRHFWWP